MATFKVVWEITMEAKTPLDAALNAQEWQRDFENTGNQFYVQKAGSKEVVSVDLDADENMILPVKKYKPLIK